VHGRAAYWNDATSLLGGFLGRPNCQARVTRLPDPTLRFTAPTARCFSSLVVATCSCTKLSDRLQPATSAAYRARATGAKWPQPLTHYLTH
jgi:hypothetical protein